MTDAAIFAGDYMDLRFMRGLKSARLYIDIPIEHADAFLKAFGAPDGANPAKVAVAKLNPEALTRREDIGPETGDSPLIERQADGKAPESRRTPFRDLPRSQQAAIKCEGDMDFRYWLTARMVPVATLSAEVADRYLKERLQITSKKELDSNTQKAAMWDALLTDFDTRSYVQR